jgi:osmoprotectant transport system ATP-binding protein
MITLRSVTKRYGEMIAVDHLSLEIGAGSLCVLIGPSGCGKTTTLKMINRLIEPSSGEILIDGENVLELNAVTLRRRIGYVMQQGGLFPHKRVADNIAVVPRLLGWDRTRIRRRVDELLELVGLEPAQYTRRFPHELSGGERQRVGVARALAGDPPVLLMDEPFGAVDPITRRNLQSDFWALYERLKKTVIFVTHDLDEATRLATNLAVLRKGGVLEQFGTPAKVLAHPATPFVAEFVSKDRAYQQLGVTLIDRSDLTFVPILAATASTREAEESLDASGAELAAVLDGADVPLGWITTKDLSPNSDASATVGDRMRPIQGRVTLGNSLRSALAVAMEADGGFATVLDAGRYAGILTLEDIHEALRRAEDNQHGPSDEGAPEVPAS